MDNTQVNWSNTCQHIQCNTLMQDISQRVNTIVLKLTSIHNEYAKLFCESLNFHNNLKEEYSKELNK